MIRIASLLLELHVLSEPISLLNDVRRTRIRRKPLFYMNQ